MIDLSIVIVSWNTSDLLEKCLTSVYTYPPNGRFEVWVVDNASHDGSVAMVQEKFPQVRLVVNKENTGFAQANNQAIEQSRSRYVLLLNPDTEVKANALDSLVQFMDAHPEAGAAGSRLLNPDGSLQLSCHPSPTLSREFWRLFHLDALYAYGRYDMQQWDTSVPREVDVAQGASMILRREVLDAVGFLDGMYFMYSEEVDLCFRLQKAGWRLYWVPQSQVVHYGGQSTRQVATKMFLTLYEGKLLFFRKHYGRLAATIYKFILLLAALARLAVTPFAWLQKGSRRQLSLTLAGRYWELIRTLPGM